MMESEYVYLFAQQLHSIFSAKGQYFSAQEAGARETENSVFAEVSRFLWQKVN